MTLKPRCFLRNKELIWLDEILGHFWRLFPLFLEPQTHSSSSPHLFLIRNCLCVILMLLWEEFSSFSTFSLLSLCLFPPAPAPIFSLICIVNYSEVCFLSHWFLLILFIYPKFVFWSCKPLSLYCCILFDQSMLPLPQLLLLQYHFSIGPF